jgi:hypothetical protein
MVDSRGERTTAKLEKEGDKELLEWAKRDAEAFSLLEITKGNRVD